MKNRILFTILGSSLIIGTNGLIGLEKASTPATDPDLARIQKTLETLHTRQTTAARILAPKTKKLEATERELTKVLNELKKSTMNKIKLSDKELQEVGQLLESARKLEIKIEQQTKALEAQ